MTNLSNFLSILRDGVSKHKVFVVVPLNKFLLNILWVLYNYGYIVGFKVSYTGIIVELKYMNGKNSIHMLKQISIIARRVYNNKVILRNILSKGSVYFVSMSSGVKVCGTELGGIGKGGEVLFKIN